MGHTPTNTMGPCAFVLETEEEGPQITQQGGQRLERAQRLSATSPRTRPALRDRGGGVEGKTKQARSGYCSRFTHASLPSG